MMKQLGICSLVFAITGCASSPTSVDIESYSRADMSVVLSARFDGVQSEAARALKPSYEKFGAPKRYVSGNMSAVYESAQDRLYGSGDLFARFSLSYPVFWEIEGEAFAADVDPIKTVHLLYDKEELDQVAFEAIEMEIRRGTSFTVFERDLGSRVVVSIYPTHKLSENAEFQTIRFQH